MSGVEFAALGPLRVVVHGRVVSAGPGKQRALLALLLLRSNEVVPVAEAIEELWDQAPPQSASANLRTYLAGIRGLLPAEERVRLVTKPHGYLLRVAESELDTLRFAALAGRGHAALAAGEYRAAADRLGEGLALWRGEPFEDVASGPVTGPRRASLREQRLGAWEDLLDARLALGEARGLRAQLRELVAADPVRERGWALLMTALYRAGDPAGALRAYTDARTAIADVLGIEPGPELRRLQQLILNSADLSGPTAGDGTAVPPTGPGWTPVWQLPLDTSGFTGRTHELAGLTAAGRERPGTVLAISGMGGVGKTALAVRWAHHHRAEFPDGQVYLDLCGYGTSRSPTTTAALGSLLRSVGVPPDRIPADAAARGALWRSTLHDRKVLVLLDNARDDDQVRPLLPATGLTLTTSRSQLRGLVIREGARRLLLDRLPASQAVALLAAGIGDDRAADPAAVAALAEPCAGLPLALRIVAERADRQSGRPLRELAAELRDERLGLASLALDDGGNTDVRAVLSWSYQALDAPTARAFRFLGLHPGGEIDSDGAAALTGLPVPRVAALLDQLVANHLLEERRAGRYAYHDLVGVYAAQQCRQMDGEADRTAALKRLLDWYVHTSDRADQRLAPRRSRFPLPPPADGVPPPRDFDGYEPALEWFKAEFRTLLAGIERAARHGLDAQCWRLAWTMWMYVQLGQPSQGWLEPYAVALEAAHRTGDRHAIAAVGSIVAMVQADLGALDEAIGGFEDALRIHTELGDLDAQARTLDNLGTVCCLAGRLEEALDHQRRALRLDEAADAPPGRRAMVYNNLSVTYSRLKRYAEAVAFAERAVDLSRASGNELDLAFALDTLGDAYRGADREPGRALRSYREALAVNRRVGALHGEAVNWQNLGATLQDAGDQAGAIDAWRHALVALERLHDPRAEEVRHQLAALGATL